MAKVRTLALLISAGTALSGSAFATSSFPYFLEQAGLPGNLPCTVCHRTNDGGKGTATRPFGISMGQLGITKDSSGGDIVAAVERSEEMNVDSDGDGVGDIAELRVGGDPNSNPDGGTAPSDFSGLPIPETGCSLARRAAGDFQVLLSCGFLACALLARRRLAGELSRNRTVLSGNRTSPASEACGTVLPQSSSPRN